MRIAFYGSSLLSAYWNGAATYYRGLLTDLARRGHRITFHEPDAFDRQKHRDIDPPDWAEGERLARDGGRLRSAIARAAEADVVVKASGVGVFDTELLAGVMAAARPDAIRMICDVTRRRRSPSCAPRPTIRCMRRCPASTSSSPMAAGRRWWRPTRASARGAACRSTTRSTPRRTIPVPPRSALRLRPRFLGNRLPDREARVEEFFLHPAALQPGRAFLLGGNGWDDKAMPGNIRRLGHVGTGEHNAFNTTPLAVLNIARDSMAQVGFSPATRVFEAAGAGACLITDAWVGLELFLKEGEEVLVARDGRTWPTTSRR
jgi:spore maturation protein CgeB